MKMILMHSQLTGELTICHKRGERDNYLGSALFEMFHADWAIEIASDNTWEVTKNKTGRDIFIAEDELVMAVLQARRLN